MAGSARRSLLMDARFRVLALGLALASGAAPALAAMPQDPASTAVFACRALTTQTCYFTVVSAATGATKSFAVKAHGMLAMPGLSLGEDRYMVAINRQPPSSEANCGGQFDKRFSLWCKKGLVREGENN